MRFAISLLNLKLHKIEHGKEDVHICMSYFHCVSIWYKMVIVINTCYNHIESTVV